MEGKLKMKIELNKEEALVSLEALGLATNRLVETLKSTHETALQGCSTDSKTFNEFCDGLDYILFWSNLVIKLSQVVDNPATRLEYNRCALAHIKLVREIEEQLKLAYDPAAN